MKLTIGNKIDKLPPLRSIFRLTVESILGDGDDYTTNVVHFTSNELEHYSNVKQLVALLEEYTNIDWNARCEMTLNTWIELYDDMFRTQPSMSMTTLIQELVATSSEHGTTYNPFKWAVTFIDANGDEYDVQVTLNDALMIGEYK